MHTPQPLELHQQWPSASAANYLRWETQRRRLSTGRAFNFRVHRDTMNGARVRPLRADKLLLLEDCSYHIWVRSSTPSLKRTQERYPNSDDQNSPGPASSRTPILAPVTLLEVYFSGNFVTTVSDKLYTYMTRQKFKRKIIYVSVSQ